MRAITAIEFNNQGCRLIEKGSYRDAISSLSQALQLVRGDENSCNPRARKHEALDENRPLHHQHIASATKMQHDGIFIFRTPMFLSQESSCTTSVYSSIVFNLAVSQHLLAIADDGTSSNDREGRLQGTLKLYELVFVLQENCGDEIELPFTHCLGLINNCGQIYKGLNRDKKANRLFQQLLKTLMVLIEQGEDEIAEMEGFISTTSHLILKASSVARAA
jgi:tetratricopeptide (TPR) repeat protein